MLTNNFPLQLTSFIGRELELAEIQRLIRKTRLLTLTGPGGCGKTRLAVQAATGLTSCFVDGVCWFELAAFAEPTLLPQALLAALGVHEQPDRSPLDVVITYLQTRELLLVLDNCEHLVAACAQVAETLLRACPAISILATSRERLGVDGERIWLVPSLTVPEINLLTVTQIPLDQLAHYEGIRLFVDRAETANRNFRLSTQNVGAVARICHRLDGIPLAIELAAARTSVLPAEQIAWHLENDFRLLDAGGRTLLPRHRTLRTTIDWSYGLLPPGEQTLLRRLSVFKGGFSLEAAESICTEFSVSTSDVSSTSALEILARLVDKSLVEVQEQAGAARYRLLETIHQYSNEKLAEREEHVLLRHRHLAWYLLFAQQADAAAFGPHRGAWIAHIEMEHDNLRTALEWSLGPDAGPESTEAGMRLAVVMSSFWYMRGHTGEGRMWLQRVLAHSRSTATALRAEALAWASALAWCQSDYEQMPALLAEGLALARLLGVDGRSALQLAVNMRGFVAFYQDEYVLATALFEEWLALLQEVDDRLRIPFALSLLGRVAVRQGDYRRATALGLQSLRLSRQSDYRRATALGLQSLRLSRQSKIVHSIAATLNLLGTVAYCVGEVEQSTAYLQESLAISRELSHKQDMADTLVMLASVALQQANLHAATKALEEGLALAREVGYRQGIALCSGRLGEVAYAEGNLPRADALLTESLSQFSALGARWHMLHIMEVFVTLWVDNATDRTLQRAACLCGAIDTLRAKIGAQRPPVEQPCYDHTVAAIRTALGAAQFATYWAKGRDMDLSHAAAYVLTQACMPDASSLPSDIGSVTLQAGIATPALRVCTLGPAQVYRDGTLVRTAEWTYAKPRELFFYLLCHPPRTREQIGLVLWPEASPVQLRRRLHASLHRMRQALGRPDSVLFCDGRYSINRSQPIWSDVEIFESNLRELNLPGIGDRPVNTTGSAAAISVQPLSLRRLDETLQLYRGDFLEEMEPYEWIVQRREELRSLYLQGLLTLGSWLFDSGQLGMATEVYRRAIAHDQYLEPAHRELMRCLAFLHGSGMALHHYHTFAGILHEEFNASPAPETVALMESLRRGRPV